MSGINDLQGSNNSTVYSTYGDESDWDGENQDSVSSGTEGFSNASPDSFGTKPHIVTRDELLALYHNVQSLDSVKDEDLIALLDSLKVALKEDLSYQSAKASGLEQEAASHEENVQQFYQKASQFYDQATQAPSPSSDGQSGQDSSTDGGNPADGKAEEASQEGSSSEDDSESGSVFSGMFKGVDAYAKFAGVSVDEVMEAIRQNNPEAPSDQKDLIKWFKTHKDTWLPYPPTQDFVRNVLTKIDSPLKTLIDGLSDKPIDAMGDSVAKIQQRIVKDLQLLYPDMESKIEARNGTYTYFSDDGSLGTYTSYPVSGIQFGDKTFMFYDLSDPTLSGKFPKDFGSSTMLWEDSSVRDQWIEWK